MTTHGRVTIASPTAILTYHRIGEGFATRVAYDVSLVQFREHLLEIAGAAEAMRGPIICLRNGLQTVLTFDDGTACHWTASRVLDEFAIKGVFFVIVDRLGREGYLTRAQLEDLVARGHVIGSHSVSHRRLNRLPAEEVALECGESRRVLANITGQDVTWFAFPGGHLNARAARIAREAGYDVVRTMQWGYATEKNSRLAPTLPIMSFHDRRHVRRMIDGDWPLWPYRMKKAAKWLIPERAYVSLRNSLVRRRISGRELPPPSPRGVVLASAESFLAGWFSRLNQAQVAYCVLGPSTQVLPKVPEGDLDVIFRREDMAAARSMLEECVAAAGAVMAQSLQDAERGIMYVVYLPHESDGRRFIKLDLNQDFHESGRLLLHGGWLLDSRSTMDTGGVAFPVAAPEREFICYLLKKVWKGRADDRSLQHLSACLHRAPKACRAELGRYWPSHATTRIEDAIVNLDVAAFSAYVEEWRAISRRTLPPIGMRAFLAERCRRLERALRPTGLVVAILGPDGAGKSTLLKDLPLRCAPLGRRCRVFHLLPPIKATPSRSMPTTDPHGLPLRGFATSVMKLGYFVLRYNAGWLASVSGPYRRTGLVYFDRYYQDMLADPARYRMGVSPWVVRLFGSLIPQPDLYLVLDVAPEVARSRKVEVKESESMRQFHAYRALAQRLPRAVLIDANSCPEEVAARCEWAIVEAMAQKAADRGRHG